MSSVTSAISAGLTAPPIGGFVSAPVKTAAPDDTTTTKSAVTAAPKSDNDTDNDTSTEASSSAYNSVALASEPTIRGSTVNTLA
jgi:hypothetical protein